MTIGGQQVRLLVDTGSSDLVLFKSRMPAALSHAPWRGDKTVQYASGAARLQRLDLRQVRLGTRVWDKLTAWALDRVLDGYPPSIDGVLGVRALDCQRVQFDFERNGARVEPVKICIAGIRPPNHVSRRRLFRRARRWSSRRERFEQEVASITHSPKVQKP